MHAHTRRRLGLGLAAAALTAIGGVAIAAAPETVLSGNATVAGKPRRVVIDAAGLTVYTLSGERVGNLKCVTKQCFSFWPPYKTPADAKLTKGPGVHGTLSKLHRVKGGFYQVMLNGHPLYRFSLDKSAGSAKGEGIQSFGGTWHVVTP
jgi:predicted lipoprotein with Yx(FWY)xxD motif